VGRALGPWRDSHGQHFEGFVGIIAVALVLGGMLTLAVITAPIADVRELGMRARLRHHGTYCAVSSRGQVAYEAEYRNTLKLTGSPVRGQSILSVQVFDVPRDVPEPDLVLDSGFSQGYFLIGESPAFHKPTVSRLVNTKELRARV